MKQKPKISVIIPTYNEEDCIERCIKSILKQKYKNLEIILVDDGSTDRTVEIARKYSIKIIKGPHKGNSVAKNTGWKVAKGDIVIFIDADMTIHPNYISETLKCYRDKKVGGTAHIELLFNKNPSLIPRLLDLRKKIGEMMSPIAIKSCRRRFINFGGYDSSFGYFDDWELGNRIKQNGYEVVWTKGKIWHEEIEKFPRLIKQARWVGKSINFKKYKAVMSKKLLYTLLCSALPIYILFLFLGSLFILGITGLVVFSLVEFYRTIKIFSKSKKAESFLIPLYDYLFENFVLVGFLEKIFLNRGVKI